MEYEIIFEECGCSEGFVEHKEYNNTPILECCKCGKITESFDGSDEI